MLNAFPSSPFGDGKMARLPRSIAIGVPLGLVACFVLLIWVLDRVTDPSIDATELFAASLANPEGAKAKYQGKTVTVRGVVRDTFLGPDGAVIHLEHRRDSQAGRFPADRVWIPFRSGQPNMGFDFQFDNRNRLILPWRDGSTIRVLATPDFQSDGMIILTKAKLL